MVSRRRVLRVSSALGVAGLAGCGTTPRSERTTQPEGDRTDTERPGDDTATTTTEEPDYDTVRVPGDHGTIQAGIDAASAGDLVLVTPGTYAEEIVVSTPSTTPSGTRARAPAAP